MSLPVARRRRVAPLAFYARRRRREMARWAAAVTLAASLSVPLRAQTGGGSWKRFAAGFATSILAHEGGHVAAALLQGAHPTFGLDHGRPTIFSGIDPYEHPHKQFMFSSAGLDVQALLDEGILDDRGRGGGPFKRGMLWGGLATVGFYLTLGRTGTVSDIDFMRRTSGLSALQLDMIYGGVALMHLVRIEHDGRFVDFFARPDARGGLRFGVDLR